MFAGFAVAGGNTSHSRRRPGASPPTPFETAYGYGFPQKQMPFAGSRRCTSPARLDIAHWFYSAWDDVAEGCSLVCRGCAQPPGAGGDLRPGTAPLRGNYLTRHPA